MNNLEDMIYAKEMDLLVNKFGSLCGILMNKNISCVTFFTQLLKDEEFRTVMAEMGNCTWFDVVRYMSYRYPLLHKSKKIKKIM